MGLFIYADPPYMGTAKKHYCCPEVDFRVLCDNLTWGRGWKYEGMALSCNSKDLRILLPLLESDTRIAAWVKPFASFKPGVNPAYTWEPVLFRTNRKRIRTEPTIRDHISANITLKKGLVGAKPEAFAFWLFNLLGMKDDDEFLDLFPGPLNTMTNHFNKWKQKTGD